MPAKVMIIPGIEITRMIHMASHVKLSSSSSSSVASSSASPKVFASHFVPYKRYPVLQALQLLDDSVHVLQATSHADHRSSDRKKPFSHPHTLPISTKSPLHLQVPSTSKDISVLHTHVLPSRTLGNSQEIQL